MKRLRQKRRLLQVEVVLSTGTIVYVSRSDTGELAITGILRPTAKEVSEATAVFEGLEDTLEHGFD
jgi:hypothetical protein